MAANFQLSLTPSSKTDLIPVGKRRSTLLNSDVDDYQEMNQLNMSPPFHCHLELSKPDALRNRMLVVESRSIYVDEYYLAVWSQVFRSWFFEEESTPHPGENRKEIVLPGKRYSHVIEMLECILPSQKEITDENLRVVLPLAHEFQIQGLLLRCIDFIKFSDMRLMEKLQLADRYNLDSLLNFCIRQIRLSTQVDFNSTEYLAMSDKTKVRILEKIHTADRRLSMREETYLDVTSDEDSSAMNLIKFSQTSSLYFGVVKSRSGRIYHVCPYYLAAWSNSIYTRTVGQNETDFVSSLNDEELVHFLLAIHPPMLKITDKNLSILLRSACKLESPGLLRKTADFLLYETVGLSMFDKLSLLDRCYLHELLEPALRTTNDSNVILSLVVHPTYECFSTKAKAAILDKISNIVKINGLRPHNCDLCGRTAACKNIKWVCPHCGGYCSSDK